MSPWEGAKLMVAEGDQLPQLKILRVYIPKTDIPTERIHQFLICQNSDVLKVEMWKIYYRDESSSKFTTMVFGVDNDAAT